MPNVIKYCDKIGNVIGHTPTVDLRDDTTTGGWGEITINELQTEMESAKRMGVQGAMHLKNRGVEYDHFCPGCSNMTLIGNSAPSNDYKLAHPRTFACLHIIQPRKVAAMAQGSPELFVRLSFVAISKAHYSAWWNQRDPKIWKRTGIGDGHLPSGDKATAIEIAINFCVDIA